jgi:hypothetical protein
MTVKAAIFKIGHQFIAIAHIKNTRVESVLFDTEEEAMDWLK